MSRKIAILEDGTEVFAETSDERLNKLYDFIERDSFLMMNTMKRFSEELINKVLQKKYDHALKMPLFFTDLRPVALLNNVGHYFFIFHLVDKCDHMVVEMFHRGKYLLCTSTDTFDSMLRITLKYFSCICHTMEEACPISGNSTLLHNFLCYLAFSVRLATLAHIEGIPNAPKWIIEFIALIFKRIHPRLMSVGGWKEIKIMCEGFEKNRASVDRVKYVKCNTIPRTPKVFNK